MKLSKHGADELEMAVGMAKESLMKGQCLPTFIGVTADGKRHILVTPWENQAQKKQSVAMVKTHFLVENIVEYTFASETWHLVRDTKAEAEFISRMTSMGKSLEHFDGRVEGLMVVYKSDTEHGLRNFETIRDAKEKIIEVRELPIDAGTTYSGTFLELLAPKGMRDLVTPETREWGRKLLRERGSMEVDLNKDVH